MENRKDKKRRFILIGVCICVLISMMVAIMKGSYNMNGFEVLRTLFGQGNKMMNAVVMQIRLPRMLVAIFVGAALSASGNILQTITKNPLAEPGIIGINAGASLAVVFYISLNKALYYDVLKINTVLFMPIVAIIGAFLSTALVYLLAYKKGIKPVRLILMGIGVNAGINAIISYYQLTASKGDYNQVLTWTNGSLWGSSWVYVGMLFPLITLLFIVVFYKSKVLDVLSLGDITATGLGVSVQKETRILFVIAAALSALATSVAGNIAFLGLLGPQIAKRLVGSRHKWQIPVGAGISATILILADTISRNLFSPLEIPVGITVSVIGVPYFVYLMMKEK